MSDQLKFKIATNNDYTLVVTDKELGDLISWAVNGPEHGVITYDQWKAKCRELVAVCKSLNIPIHGQWTIV